MRWWLALAVLWLLTRLGGLLMLMVTAAAGEAAWGADWLWWLPLDGLLVAFLLLWLPPWRLVWSLVALLLMLAVTLNLASGAMLAVFGRDLNVWLDASLLSAGYQLLTSNLGPWTGSVIVGLMVVGLCALGVGLGWLLIGTARYSQSRSLAWRGTWSGALVALVVITLALDHWHDRPRLGIDAPLASVSLQQARQLPLTLAARQRFQERQQARQPAVTALPALAGQDVVLIFIESYGMSLLERDAADMPALLQRHQASLARQGISMVSGRLRSPVRGGQSWLAHASVLSGLTIDNDLDYRLMLDDVPRTLVQDFAATGHRTMTVMPAITQPWPEGRALGFDRLIDAAAMDYAGPALHWVTMPDQFTLKTLATRWLNEPASPVFAQVALISSHAPWTPVLPVRDWQDVQDGQGFQPWAEAGPAPEQLWRNMDDVRRHYADAVRYSLSVTLEWVERYLDDDTLVMVMGDHPAAPVVTGADASPDVPVHVFGRNASRVNAFRAHGFQAGLIPPAAPAEASMACWRHWLHQQFGSQASGRSSSSAPALLMPRCRSRSHP